MGVICKALKEEVALQLELSAVLDRIAFLQSKLTLPMDVQAYIFEIEALIETLNTGLHRVYFYHYPEAKAKLLLQFDTDWKTVCAAFKKVRQEALAASDCYALGHNTAAVFHSMRVAEYGLRALAKERRITLKNNKPVEWANWQDILKELRNEETRISQKKSGAAKDRALAFYSGAHSDLMAFKDEYRNLVMHVRADYDQYQALRALTRVMHFMQRISERLSDKNHRIRWGLK